MKTKQGLKIILTKAKSKLPLITFGFILLLLIFSQCTVISFYPLYTQKELVRDDRIVGKWMSKLIKEEVSEDSMVWEINFREKKWKNKLRNNVVKGNKQVSNSFTYKLKIYSANQDDDNTAEFDVHIVKLNDDFFLDFLLDDWDTDNAFSVMHVLPVHTFAKLEVGEGKFTVKWLDGDFLEELLEGNKIRIRHEKRKDASLLTAKPKELQKFIIKYADNEDAYEEDLSFDLSPYNPES